MLCFSFSAVAIFGIFVGWRLYRKGILLERNEINTKNNRFIEDECRLWMSGYLSIIDHSCLFPERVDLEHLKAGREFSVVGMKSLTFSADIDYIVLFQELLSPLRHRLLRLAEDKMLDINIWSIGSLDDFLRNAFVLAWCNLDLPENLLPEPVFITQSFAQLLDEWIDKPEKSIIYYSLVIRCRWRKENQLQVMLPVCGY